MNTQQFVAQAEQAMPQYLDDLQTIVNIDSGTYTKAGVDRVGDYLSKRKTAPSVSLRILNGNSNTAITLLLIVPVMYPMVREYSADWAY